MRKNCLHQCCWWWSLNCMSTKQRTISFRVYLWNLDLSTKFLFLSGVLIRHRHSSKWTQSIQRWKRKKHWTRRKLNYFKMSIKLSRWNAISQRLLIWICVTTRQKVQTTGSKKATQENKKNRTLMLLIWQLPLKSKVSH